MASSQKRPLVCLFHTKPPTPHCNPSSAEAASAAPKVRSLKVVLMDPVIGCHLLPFYDILRLMVHPAVPCVRIVVQDTGPDQGFAALWLHRQAQSAEVCLASFLHVGEVQEEREYPMPRRLVVLPSAGVVMAPVELPLLILQYLERLVVALGHPRNGLDPLRYGHDAGKSLARPRAPCVRRRPRLAHHLLLLPHGVRPSLVRAPFKPLVLPPPDEVVALRVGHERSERHDPRPVRAPVPPPRAAQHLWLVPPERLLRRPRLEQPVQVTGPPRRLRRVQERLPVAPDRRVDEPPRVQLLVAALAAVHDHPTGTSTAPPRLGRLPARREPIPARVGRGGGVGRYREPLARAGRRGREFHLPVRRGVEETLADAVADHEERVGVERVDGHGTAVRFDRPDVRAVPSVVPVHVGPVGGRIDHRDGERSVGSEDVPRVLILVASVQDRTVLAHLGLGREGPTRQRTAAAAAAAAAAFAPEEEGRKREEEEEASEGGRRGRTAAG
eukprot:CAMPEP_0183293376 /NCGR_PEP_ID=MMETSP0160_2-20130417/2075_1 /TAXON_ID=2839 ORGANISM="Odontella Sinensis, Strain Grunow 1884" /NCGR_SAMPLE_ID=MMETSP0160_2 /ASSEMBLY_ACC=CAM_ASM_000250 /LENGTH=498 /DNA_ID=CAMNT_0025454479 /DNA_START=297 /DNA_END=1793 /DNA_ORIENTATION=-